MSQELVKLNPSEWAKVSENTLRYSFVTEWPVSKNRIDYALIVQGNEDKEPYAFSTIIEVDSETVYMQHGGNYPASQGTILTVKAYLMMISYLKKNYKTISTNIWNKNKAMLKLAWSAGFIVTGTMQDKYGDIYLIHEIDCEEKPTGQDA